MGRLADHTGRSFDRLTALRHVGVRGKKHFWLCRCTCGKNIEVAATHLVGGKIRSCGCIRREQIGALNKTHGQSVGRKVTPTYSSWQNMHQRCSNPNHPKFKHYGARGIRVCSEWNDFEAFRADMGERPLGHTIGRQDNEGNYEKSNCRWETARQQGNNTRRNVKFEWHGEQLTLSEIARLEGVNRRYLCKCVRDKGQSVHRAVQAMKRCP